jgi:hypothetical protein
MSLLTFRFRHSRADDLPWLIELAKRGRFKEQALSQKQIVYETSFNLLDPIQLGHALSLATALVHDKKAEVFAGSLSLTMVNVREVLRCYQQSLQGADPQAYCWFRTALSFDLTVTTFVIDDAPKTLIFPCRQAGPHSYGLHPGHPGTVTDQVEAALVRAGTRWCPRLADLTEWRAANSMIARSAP